ncbi:FAD dependent oxidoreductase [Epithele typhae]|uniref:FAD dependent oxidoreductase n=1 Tax=Epithele typhae TaxID=378194 RepID=UPI002007DEA2|nr:FAD dependent oxidoreductase [Epithele typhae]KAH9933172.1 FAD dependent oxidoreductase [Epithele typhae]
MTRARFAVWLVAAAVAFFRPNRARRRGMDSYTIARRQLDQIEGSTGPLTPFADVCIIGSGISGLSAAYNLADEPGLGVVVFEARDFCSGATGRNGGHLTPYLFQDFRKKALQFGSAQAKAGFDLEQYNARALVKIIQDEGIADAIDLVHGGHTCILMSDEDWDDLQNDFEAARAAGTDLSSVAWFTKKEMYEKYGTHYAGFTFDVYNLWPLKLVTQFYHIAKRRLQSSSGSLSLHTNTPVNEVLPSGEDWELVTPRGSTTCKYVLHTTNGYAGHLLPSMSGEAGIVPGRGQVVTTHLRNTGMSSWSNLKGDEYWFPRPGGAESPLIILGGGGHTSGVVDDSVTEQHYHNFLLKFLPEVFDTPQYEPEMEWTGIMGFTSIGDPFVGPLEPLEGRSFKGQYISAGFSGHGMPRTFASAQSAAQMILANLHGETWAQPEWIPDRFLTWNRV